MNKISYTLLVIVFFLMLSSNVFGQIASCSGDDIGGTVFREYSANGVQDTGEPGVEGVIVNIYDDTGLVATTTTEADGSYAFTALTAGATYRLEFDLPSGLYSSPVGGDSPTSVQFLTTGNCASNFGVHYPSDYCQDNPRLFTSCYLYDAYNGPNANSDALVSWLYDEGGKNNPSSKVEEATHAEIGTTWGLAYHKESQNLLLASLMKRHSSFGPGGVGAIYRKDMTTGAISVWFDLEATFGAGTAGVDPHPIGSTDFECDPNSWDPVGKMSWGDIDISDDQSTLYGVNLTDKSLYVIDITAFPATPTAADISVFPIPEDATCPDAANNIRPFALNYHEGTLYVGTTCTGETTQNTADLHAYVYSFDPATNSFNTAPVLDFPLDYVRGCAVLRCDQYGGQAEWNPWSTTWKAQSTYFGSEYVYPQPWLTDIEFSDNNEMIIGLRDRYGEQSGFQVKATDCSNKLYIGDVAGDILIAAPTGTSSWTIESNAQAGSLGPTAGAGTGQGPDGGEFFHYDYYLENGSILHDETSQGGLLVLPGRNEVVQTAYDVSLPFQGGISWLDLSDGGRNNYMHVFKTAYNSATTYGKGGGLGDIEAMCEPAPLEIGNYIWVDSDGDGVQDPSETPIPGLTVNLYTEDPNSPGTYILVGQTTTDANGQYYFNEANVDVNGVSPLNGNPTSGSYTGLDPFTTYYIAIDNPDQYDSSQGILDVNGSQYVLTTQNMGEDDSDSDAAIASIGAPFDDYPFVEATTGGPGVNDHTFDIGFLDGTCKILTGVSTALPSLCAINTTTDATISHEVDANGNFKLVYDTAPLSVVDLYNGMGTLLQDNIAPTAAQNYTVVNGLAFPPNTTTSPITYYVYGLLATGHPDYDPPLCRPFVATTVTIYPPTPEVVLSNEFVSVCDRDTTGAVIDNELDLSTLITSGPTDGVWSDDDASGGLTGSLFTANTTMTGNVYNFTYTIPGDGADGTDCADKTYTVTVLINECPCIGERGVMCPGDTFQATADATYTNIQWFKDGTALTGETNVNLTITTTGIYHYTALNASGCNVELLCVVEITDQERTATLLDQAEVCNIDLGGGDNVVDLNTLILAGDVTGVWEDTGASGALTGSTFTATSAMAGNTYTFTYRLAATAPCVDVTYPVTITVNNCSCPSINAAITPTAVCFEEVFSMTLMHSDTPGDLAIYYNSGTVLTDADLYSAGNGGATQLTTLTGSATASTINGIQLAPGTYNIYAILDSSNPEIAADCQPMASNVLTVYGITEPAYVEAPLPICNTDLGASDNSLDLNSLVTGNMTGTWIDDDATGGLSGSVFTATTAGTYSFTYSVAGASGAGTGACNDQSYSIQLEVQDCSCPIIELQNAPAVICSDETFELTFMHTSNPGDLALYYMVDDGIGLTASQLYATGNGGALPLVSPITPTTNTGSTLVTANFPPNTSGSNISYLVYGILENGNTFINDPNCIPLSMTSVLVNPATPAYVLDTPPTLCEADFGLAENVLNLNDLITTGDPTMGYWVDEDGSGGLLSSFFTATPAMAGNTYNFTYIVPGLAGEGSGACNDQTYPITITVNACTIPCPEITNLIAPVAVCSDETFSLTIEHSADIGNLALYYSDSVAVGAVDFYTGAQAFLDPVNTSLAPPSAATSTTLSVTLPANTDTIPEKIYFYVGLSADNPNFNNPYCMPFYTVIVRQDAVTPIATVTTDAIVCDRGEVLDLSSLITEGTTLGEWVETTDPVSGALLGSTFVYDPSMGAGPFTLTYMLDGTSDSDVPNACTDMVYPVTITVEACCPIPVCIPISITKR